MKKRSMRIMATMLVMAMLAVAVAACADNGNDTQAPATPATPAPPATAVTIPGEVTPDEPDEPDEPDVVEVEEEVTPLGYFAEFFETMAALTAFDGEVAVAADETLVLTFGMYGTTPITYEFLMDLIKEFIIAEMFMEPLPDFYDLLEEFSLQLIINAAYDGDTGIELQVGIPTENGGVFNLIDMVFVDNVYYIGIASYLDIIEDLFGFVAELMVYMGMSPLEVHMVTLIVEDILDDFAGIDFIAVDASELLGMDVLEMMEMSMDSPEFQIIMEMGAKVGNIFVEAFNNNPTFRANVESAVSRDGDWAVFEVDERQMQLLFEDVLEILDDNAEDFVYAINRINAIDMFEIGTAAPAFVISAQDLRDAISYYDPSAFDEFEGVLVFKARSGDDVMLEMDFTMIIDVPSEDITVWMNMYSISTERTAPISSPAGAVTIEYILENILADYMDMFMEMIPHIL